MATHREVVANWIKGKDSRGFAMFAEGATIYSYGSHFPIAIRVKDHKGRTCFLFTDEGYSLTTAKHKTYTMHGLCRLDAMTYRVPSLKPYVNGVAIDTWHQFVVDGYNARIADRKDKMTRARVYKDLYARGIERFTNERDAYIAAFEVEA